MLINSVIGLLIFIIRNIDVQAIFIGTALILLLIMVYALGVVELFFKGGNKC